MQFWAKETYMNDSDKKILFFKPVSYYLGIYLREKIVAFISRFRILLMERPAMISVLVFLCLFSIGQSCRTSTPPRPIPTTSVGSNLKIPNLESTEPPKTEPPVCP